MPLIVDHDARRRAIVAVAKRLLTKGGFRAATMRSLAAEAGFANGALSHYFASKDDILAATFTSVVDEIDVSFPPGHEPTPAEELERIVRASLPLDPEQIEQGRVLLALWDYSIDNERVRDAYRAHLERWRAQLVDILQRGIACGDFRDDIDVDGTAREAIGSAIGVTVLALMSDEPALTDFGGYPSALVERLRATS